MEGRDPKLLIYHTQNVVCKECLCYRKEENNNDLFHDDGVASTNEDEGSLKHTNCVPQEMNELPE